MRKGRLLWNISVSSIGASVWSHHYYSTSKWTCTWWICIAAAAAKSLQSCPTLCDPIDGSPPGSAVPGILQARILEWVAISFSNAWKWKVKVKSVSRVRLFSTPWTAAYQAPPSMGFSRQEYWSGVPLPSSNMYWVKGKSNLHVSLKINFYWGYLSFVRNSFLFVLFFNDGSNLKSITVNRKYYCTTLYKCLH